VTYEYDQEILRQVRENGDILRQIRDALKLQPSEIERLARVVVRKWHANWGPVEHHREFIEALKNLTAAVEKEKP
jgi:hypothetical protein